MVKIHMKVVVCGSMAHYDEFLRAKEELERFGHEVVIPESKEDTLKRRDGQAHLDKFIQFEIHKKDMDFPADHPIWEHKADAIRGHYAHIEKGDVILVVNCHKNGVDHYIGGNTLMEIGYAFGLGKKIYLLNPVPEVSYKQEVFGVQPVIIHGDFSKVCD